MIDTLLNDSFFCQHFFFQKKLQTKLTATEDYSFLLTSEVI